VTTLSYGKKGPERGKEHSVIYFFLNEPTEKLPAILKREKCENRQSTNTTKKQQPQRAKGEKTSRHICI
jgi:hypothetical protein